MFGLTRRRFLGQLGALGVTGSAMTMGVAHADEPHPVRSPLNTLTDRDEIALGNLLGADIEKEYPVVHNPAVDVYLSGIVGQLAAVSQRPDLPYQCNLVNADALNAFSILGGRMYVYRGLVEQLESEDELMATISHEMGHIVARHSANQMMLTFRARQAYDLVKNNIPQHAQMIQQVIEQLGGMVALLALLHFSREAEFEADKLGLYETIRAGWDPSGFLSLFATFAALERDSHGVPTPLLRDHPPARDRAAAKREELAETNVPRGLRTDSMGFQAFRLAMNLLPPPVSPKPARGR